MNFVDAHDFSVDLVLRVLGIPPSTYYGWRKARTEPSRRAREDAELLRLIDKIRGEHEFAATYGSPRVWLELRRRGIKVGRKRVERIMRENGRQGAYLRKGWKHGSTRQDPRHSTAPARHTSEGSIPGPCHDAVVNPPTSSRKVDPVARCQGRRPLPAARSRSVRRRR